MIENISRINGAINGVVWGIPMLALIIGTGVYMSIRTKFFQLSKAKHVMENTIGGVFKKNSNITDSSEKTSISQFQASLYCTCCYNRCW